MPFVSERWLGGCLTNYRTIRDRLKRLQELETMWLPAHENAARTDLPAYMRGMLNEVSGKLDLTKAPESASIRGYSKKMVATLNRELTKIHRNLSGIREMTYLPTSIVVVDPGAANTSPSAARRRYGRADRHRQDLDVVDLPIPGNDDSIRSIESRCWASWPTRCWKVRRRCRPSIRRTQGRGRGHISLRAEARGPRPPPRPRNKVNRTDVLGV